MVLLDKKDRMKISPVSHSGKHQHAKAGVLLCGFRTGIADHWPSCHHTPLPSPWRISLIDHGNFRVCRSRPSCRILLNTVPQILSPNQWGWHEIKYICNTFSRTQGWKWKSINIKKKHFVISKEGVSFRGVGSGWGDGAVRFSSLFKKRLLLAVFP